MMNKSKIVPRMTIIGLERDCTTAGLFLQENKPQRQSEMFVSYSVIDFCKLQKVNRSRKIIHHDELSVALKNHHTDNVIHCVTKIPKQVSFIVKNAL